MFLTTEADEVTCSPRRRNFTLYAVTVSVPRNSVYTRDVDSGLTTPLGCYSHLSIKIMSRVVYHDDAVTRVTKVSAANRWKFGRIQRLSVVGAPYRITR